MTSIPKALTPVVVRGRIDSDLEERARKLAEESGHDFRNHFCITNAWFAALAAMELGRSNVEVVAGFRERPDRRWYDDAHIWICIDGEHLEASPENDPSSVQYLARWVLEPDENLRKRVFAPYGHLLQDLWNWISEAS